MKQILCAVFACGLVWAQAKSDADKKAAHKAGAAKPSLTDPSTMKAKAPPTFQAKFTTTKGDFTIQVTRSWAPMGADRFYNLVRGGFFTNAAFFRVIPGFMVQFGIS